MEPVTDPNGKLVAVALSDDEARFLKFHIKKKLLEGRHLCKAARLCLYLDVGFAVGYSITDPDLFPAGFLLAAAAGVVQIFTAIIFHRSINAWINDEFSEFDDEETE